LLLLDFLKQNEKRGLTLSYLYYCKLSLSFTLDFPTFLAKLGYRDISFISFSEFHQKIPINILKAKYNFYFKIAILNFPKNFS
jgi:hypothetical protein